MAHTFNLSTERQMQKKLCEFEASLVYTVSSRTVKDIESPCLKKSGEDIRFFISK